MASAAVVLVVGAIFKGHASLSTLTSKWASANFARDELGSPVRAISLAPVRLMIGTIVSNSSVSPELEMATKTSSRVTMPKSP